MHYLFGFKQSSFKRGVFWYNVLSQGTVLGFFLAFVLTENKISEITEAVKACAQFTIHVTPGIRERGVKKGHLITTVIKKDHPSQNWVKICA